MGAKDDIWEGYERERSKLSRYPDADADFIALDNAYKNLDDKKKLEMAEVLTEEWRKRCIDAESLLAALRDKMQKINDIAVNYQEDGPFIDTVTFAIISEIYDLSLGKE